MVIYPRSNVPTSTLIHTHPLNLHGVNTRSLISCQGTDDHADTANFMPCIPGDYIAVVVQKLRAGRAGGPLGMKEENQKTWIREAIMEKDPETEKWEKLVSIMQAAFQDEYISEALAWKMMVLIPNGGGGYRGIGLD